MDTTRLRLLTAVLTLGLSISAGPTRADELSECAAAAASPYQSGYEDIGVAPEAFDPATAIAACTAAVESDPENTDARAFLARAYFLADRLDEMSPHLEIAAEAGNASAQQILGDSFALGRGVEADPARSFALLSASADQGFAPGLYSLGLNHLDGIGTDIDASRAAALFEQAAEAGLASAMAELAYLLMNGDGVTVDEERAIALYQEAAALGDAYALIQIGNIYADPDHALHAPQDAYEAFVDAGDLGDALGTAYAAEMLLGLYGVDADHRQAIALAENAIASGEGYGHFVLGQMDELGLGGPVNLGAARAHYRAGAALGDPTSGEALNLLNSSDG